MSGLWTEDGSSCKVLYWGYIYGVHQKQYNAAKHGREEIHWFCRPCEDRYWPNPADAPAADAPVPDADPADAPAPDDDPADAPAPDADPADAPAPDDDPADAPAPDDDPADAPAPDDDPLEGSFDVGHRRASIHPEPMDTSLNAEPELPDDILPDDGVINYKILEKGSKRGGRLLIASNGYTFGVKVKERVSAQPHSRAGGVVTDVVTSVIAEEQRFLAPKQSLLKRTANKFRSANTPREPTDLDFELDVDFLQCEDFLVDDVRVGDQRHLIFATPFQRNLLRHSKRWFMDGTFKVVKDPFKRSGQLLSIHSFILQDGRRKQLPLAFVLMSRKTEEDYVAVLQALVDRLEETSVEEFMVDYEVGAWLAIRRVFPTVAIKGCIFHWTQAVWRHVQYLGLARAYKDQQAVHNYIRQLLSLPFLPAQQIPETFHHLRGRATTPQLRDLVDYIDRQWFRHRVFRVQDWSVFRRTVRTNNDVEGWHNRLNTMARHGGVPFYKLVLQLRQEAEVVDVAVRSADLERESNRVYTALEKRIQKAWDEYMEGAWITSHFL
uniref:MULE transposase domain-containing protein n=1 Tax=Magallana gigas TaxID=29159 RepID=A0A8W8MYX2_MAGGI